MNRRTGREGLFHVTSAMMLAWLLAIPFLGISEQPEAGPGLCVQPQRVRFSRLRDGRQLVVSEVGPEGRARDLTGEVRYAVEPDGVAVVTSGGYVRPVGTGKATVTIEHAGRRAVVEVEATDRDEA